jgi:hypothetical protein
MTKVRSNRTSVNHTTPPKPNVSFTIEANADDLIGALNHSITELELQSHNERNEKALCKLKWLREKFIETNYDANTFKLMRLILSEDLNSFRKPVGEWNAANFEKYNERSREIRQKNIASAKLLKPKRIDLNRDHFASIGGISQIIKALTNSIPVLTHESGDPYDQDVNLLSDLRDTLVKEYYGLEAFNLFERITM